MHEPRKINAIRFIRETFFFLDAILKLEKDRLGANRKRIHDATYIKAMASKRLYRRSGESAYVLHQSEIAVVVLSVQAYLFAVVAAVTAAAFTSSIIPAHLYIDAPYSGK